MNITPLDIRQQSFKKKFGGYDPDEVRAFLEMVASEFEELIKNNNSLLEKLRKLEQSLSEYREIEKTLRDTLILAQKTATETMENARKEAQMLIKEAEIHAERISGQALGQVAQLTREVADLKNTRNVYLMRLKSTVESHLKLLEAPETSAMDLSEIKSNKETYIQQMKSIMNSHLKLLNIGEE